MSFVQFSKFSEIRRTLEELSQGNKIYFEGHIRGDELHKEYCQKLDEIYKSFCESKGIRYIPLKHEIQEKVKISKTKSLETEAEEIMLENKKLSDEEETHYCMECDNEVPADFLRSTQFAGDHYFCKRHAEEQKDFMQEDSSYKYWIELNSGKIKN